jgi:RNA polymerase sigma-70 factor, ECF subfamily
VRRSSSLPASAVDHLDSLYRVARRLTGHDDEAEELVQETFARAVASASQFRQGTNLRAWLFRILRNAHIDAYRRAQANPVGRGSVPNDATPEDAPTREPLRGDPELERLRGIVARDIEVALDSLSPDARAIVLLDLEGFSGEELADILGCAVGTVKSRLSRARETLRNRLCEYAE